MDGKEWRVLSGVGLVLVRAASDGMLEVWEDHDDKDDSYLESETDLADYLRPLVSKGEAEAFVEQLASPFPADRFVPPDLRARSYEAAFAGEDFETLVDTLHRLYQTPDVTAADTTNLSRFEGAVIDELAHVLGMSPKALKVDIRRRAGAHIGSPPVILPDRSAELASQVLPSVEGWEPVGAFAIEDTIAIGDRPLLEARPGIWHARYRISEFEIPDAIVLVHSDVSAEMVDYLRQVTPDEHKVFGARGTMHVADGALRDDADWHRAYGDYDDLEIRDGRGFKVYMEADGDHRPGVALADGKAVLVHITNS